MRIRHGRSDPCHGSENGERDAEEGILYKNEAAFTVDPAGGDVFLQQPVCGMEGRAEAVCAKPGARRKVLPCAWRRMYGDCGEVPVGQEEYDRIYREEFCHKAFVLDGSCAWLCTGGLERAEML